METERGHVCSIPLKEKTIMITKSLNVWWCKHWQVGTGALGRPMIKERRKSPEVFGVQWIKVRTRLKAGIQGQQEKWEGQKAKAVDQFVKQVSMKRRFHLNFLSVVFVSYCFNFLILEYSKKKHDVNSNNDKSFDQMNCLNFRVIAIMSWSLLLRLKSTY